MIRTGGLLGDIASFSRSKLNSVSDRELAKPVVKSSEPQGMFERVKYMIVQCNLWLIW